MHAAAMTHCNKILQVLLLRITPRNETLISKPNGRKTKDAMNMKVLGTQKRLHKLSMTKKMNTEFLLETCSVLCCIYLQISLPIK